MSREVVDGSGSGVLVVVVVVAVVVVVEIVSLLEGQREVVLLV
jgi:hypothetical protein